MERKLKCPSCADELMLVPKCMKCGWSKLLECDTSNGSNNIEQLQQERDTYKKQLDEVKEYMQKSVYSATGITHLQEKDGKVTGRAVVGVRIIGNEEDFLIGLMKRLESEVE